MLYRSKDYTAPVSFISAGLRKTAAEDKEQQQKGEGGSDESDDESSSAPPARGIAPKTLQMVNLLFVLHMFLKQSKNAT